MEHVGLGASHALLLVQRLWPCFTEWRATPDWSSICELIAETLRNVIGKGRRD